MPYLYEIKITISRLALIVESVFFLFYYTGCLKSTRTPQYNMFFDYNEVSNILSLKEKLYNFLKFLFGGGAGNGYPRFKKGLRAAITFLH